MGKPALPYRNFSVEEVLKAVEGSGGFATVIARRLGAKSTTTVYAWRDRSEAVREAWEWEHEKQCDFVEGRIQERIRDGSDPIIMMFARTKMRHRGYSERLETLNVSLEGLTRNQLERIRDGEDPLSVIGGDSGGGGS